MVCPKCGTQTEETVVFCPNCGNNLKEVNPPKSGTEIELLEENVEVKEPVVPQAPVQSDVSNNDNSSKGNTAIIICIVIVAIVLLGIIIASIIAKNDKTIDKGGFLDQTETSEKTYYNFDINKLAIEKDMDGYSDKIEIKDKFFNYTKDITVPRAMIYGKNHNQEMVRLKITIDYYDKTGQRIDQTFDEIKVIGDSEFVVAVSVKDDAFTYETAKIGIHTKKLESYFHIIPAEQYELRYTKSTDKFDDSIYASVTNKSNYKVTYHLGCLYLKNNKVVFANAGYANIEPNIASKVTFGNYLLNLEPIDEDTKQIEYDDFKVFVYSAYYTDDNY